MEAEAEAEAVMAEARIALPGMTPTAATLGADVRATPTVCPRLRDCMGGNSAGSRKNATCVKSTFRSFMNAPQPPLETL